MPADAPVDVSRYDHGAMLLTALANRNRLVVLRILMKGEMSISALSLLTGIGRTTLSQHLAKLHEAQLVVRRREAQTIYYSCPSDEVRRILRTLEGIWPNTQIRRKSVGGISGT